jgi:hypothetical protein
MDLQALKMVRSMRSDLELRRSKMHMAMRGAREAKVKLDKATRHGNFGARANSAHQKGAHPWDVGRTKSARPWEVVGRALGGGVAKQPMAACAGATEDGSRAAGLKPRDAREAEGEPGGAPSTSGSEEGCCSNPRC